MRTINLIDLVDYIEQKNNMYHVYFKDGTSCKQDKELFDVVNNATHGELAKKIRQK